MADHLDNYIDAVSKALRLPVEDAWRPAVRANLEVSLRLAGLVDEFPLPDDAPEYYVDYGETGPYVAETGESECAT